jgi:hypothetical protein
MKNNKKEKDNRSKSKNRKSTIIKLTTTKPKEIKQKSFRFRKNRISVLV